MFKNRFNFHPYLAGIVFLGACLCGRAVAAQPATLLGPNLAPQSVVLRSLSPDRILVTDAQGNAKTLGADEVLRLTFRDSAPPRIEAGYAVATLRDGQVVIGKLVASDEDEAIRLALDAGGAVDLSLDDLLSIQLTPDASVPKTEDDDVLLLATGETLVGFVETIGQASVGFVVGDADDAIPIPLERIKALSIANKAEPVEPAMGLIKAQLTDGSTLLLSQAVVKEQQLLGTMTLGGDATKAALPMHRVAQIELLSGRHRLSALMSQPREVVAGGEVFGVAMPPAKQADGGLRLHAPTTLRFDLPRGSRRLVFSATLDLDDTLPAARRALAGCELIVYDGQQQLATISLSPDEPPQRINVPLTEGALRIELAPGVNGPVLDRVRLFDAEVLVGE